MLGLTPASKLVRPSFPLARQQFHIPHIRQTWSDFHLFGPLKESLRGQHFSSDEVVEAAVQKWLETQLVEFYNEGICALVKRWEKAVRKAGDYIEK